MNFFRDAIDKRAEQSIALNPAVQSGRVIHTTDVINKNLENPYFYSVNNMSSLDAAIFRDKILSQDSIKSGLSIAVKDVNGVTRSERVFCNPKFADTQILGNASGKLPGPDKGTTFVLADMVFSGTNNQLPTVIGIQPMVVHVSDRVNSTEQDITEATPATDISGVGANSGAAAGAGVKDNKSIGAKTGAGIGAGATNSEVIKPSLSGPIGTLPPMLDKKGNPLKKDPTKIGPYGNPIRTGTVAITNTELSDLVNAAWYGDIL